MEDGKMTPTNVTANATASIRAFRAPEGCTAYLVTDPATREALVVDPRLDQVEEILEAARGLGVRIRDVVDTHTHADHLSGARRLAERAEATLLAPSGSRLQAPARRIGPGASFRVGELDVRVLAAPGHTPDAVAFLAAGHLFTGDALFVEGVGRTDFPGGSPDELLDTLEAFEALPDETVVHPGHDYRKLGEAPLSRLRAEHPVLSLADRAARRDRVAGKGLDIPDIRDFLSWNLAAVEPRPLPPRAAADLVRGRTAAFVDVRTPAEFAQARIDGAILLPLNELEKRLPELPDGRELVLVCRTGRRAESAREILARSGRTGLVMEGGIEAWRAGRLPLVEPRPGVLPIDRQVQLAAGSLVVIGTVLAALLSPWFLAIPGFVGAGLVFAGSTGTCGLARLLGALPWNRPSAAAPAPSCSAGACSAGGARP
jgi:glyoxylase-like metal-dependent hydrolase (beta-lactamase superfamily II)